MRNQNNGVPFQDSSLYDIDLLIAIFPSETGLSDFLCKWPVSYVGSRPGKTIAKWFRAVGQSCTGRVHRSLAFMMAR